MNDKKSIFIVCTGIIISVGRCLIGVKNVGVEIMSINEEHILIFMAIINYVAFGVVILFLLNDLKKDCALRIDKAGLDTNKKTNCKKTMKFHSMIFMILYLGIGITYIILWKSSECNDIISILALSISIASNGLVKEYGRRFYKHILNFTETKLITYLIEGNFL